MSETYKTYKTYELLIEFTVKGIEAIPLGYQTTICIEAESLGAAIETEMNGQWKVVRGHELEELNTGEEPK